MPVNVVLHEPEIPANTGNIIRLCANTGAALHLVRPLGFAMDDRRLRRAGLDYDEYAAVVIHDSWPALVEHERPTRAFAITTKGNRVYSNANFEHDDWVVFGSETRGLPPSVMAQFASANRLRIPMQEESRSLNLSNAAAVVIYEAWRQRGFTGGRVRP